MEAVERAKEYRREVLRLPEADVKDVQVAEEAAWGQWEPGTTPVTFEEATWGHFEEPGTTRVTFEDGLTLILTDDGEVVGRSGQSRLSPSPRLDPYDGGFSPDYHFKGPVRDAKDLHKKKEGRELLNRALSLLARGREKGSAVEEREWLVAAALLGSWTAGGWNPTFFGKYARPSWRRRGPAKADILEVHKRRRTEAEYFPEGDEFSTGEVVAREGIVEALATLRKRLAKTKKMTVRLGDAELEVPVHVFAEHNPPPYDLAPREGEDLAAAVDRWLEQASPKQLHDLDEYASGRLFNLDERGLHLFRGWVQKWAEQYQDTEFLPAIRAGKGLEELKAVRKRLQGSATSELERERLASIERQIERQIEQEKEKTKEKTKERQHDPLSLDQSREDRGREPADLADPDQPEEPADALARWSEVAALTVGAAVEAAYEMAMEEFVESRRAADARQGALVLLQIPPEEWADSSERIAKRAGITAAYARKMAQRAREHLGRRLPELLSSEDEVSL